MSDAIAVQGVPAQMAQLWWPRIAHWCEEALGYSGGLLDLEDVKQAVASRDMQLWVIHDGKGPVAACVTEIRRWPRASVLTVLLLGGEQMHSWVAALDDTLTRFAQSQGCKGLDCYGRKGWSKALRNLGWRERVVMCAKEIQ